MSETSGVKKAVGTALVLPGGVITLISLALTATVLASMAQGKATPGAFGALVFFLGCDALGAWLLRRGVRAFKEARTSEERSSEVALLKALATRGGRATGAEIAVLLDLRPSEAEALADKLAQQGQLEVLVSPDGVVVYEAHGLLSHEKKQQAEAIPGMRVSPTNTDNQQASDEADLAAAQVAYEAEKQAGKLRR